MKKKYLITSIVLVVACLIFSFTYSFGRKSNIETIKKLSKEISEKSKNDDLSASEKEELHLKYKQLHKLIEEEKEAKKEQTESSTEYKKVQNELIVIYNEAVKKFQIDESLYDVLEFSQCNDYFNKIEDVKLRKELDEKFKSLYFYDDIKPGNSKPFILIKKDLSEVIVGYKDVDGAYTIQKAKKEKEAWTESKDVCK